MSVLGTVLEWYKLEIPMLSYFCTYSLARRTWQGLEAYSLTALGEHFGIIYNAHNALDDAFTCGKLVQLAAEKFSTEKKIEELLEYFGVEIKCLR